MNVGLLLNKVPPHTGGGYTFIAEVLRSLAEMEKGSSHTYTVFYEEDSEVPVSTEHIKCIQIRPPKELERLTIRGHLKKRIKNIFEPPLDTDGWIDDVIVRSGVEIMWYLAPFQYHVMDVPYITTVWDLQHRLQPYFPEVSLYGEWDSRENRISKILKRAAAVIVGTDAGKEEVERFYQVPPGRIRKLPHPTPTDVLEAPAEKSSEVLSKYSVPEGYLFYPAQFWPHKNHAGILYAVRLLKNKYDIKLPVVFVGSDKGNLSYIKNLTSNLGLSRQVHFLGFVPREDLISLYRHAFALVYLTFFGPENMPPLEAFALGCPVIASNVAGSEEQLGDAAVLVDPRDESQIASAIRSIYNDNNFRETLIARGKQRAMRFTGRDFIKEFCSILDDFASIRRCWSSEGPYHPPR